MEIGRSGWSICLVVFVCDRLFILSSSLALAMKATSEEEYNSGGKHSGTVAQSGTCAGCSELSVARPENLNPSSRSPQHLLSKSAAEMASQTVSASQAVGEMLQSPDDLGKIANLRKKLEKEKALIDVKLKSGVKDQLEATREALRKLVKSRDSVQSVKEQMFTIDKMCGEQQNTVKTFDKINRVRQLTT